MMRIWEAGIPCAWNVATRTPRPMEKSRMSTDPIVRAVDAGRFDRCGPSAFYSYTAPRFRRWGHRAPTEYVDITPFLELWR